MKNKNFFIYLLYLNLIIYSISQKEEVKYGDYKLKDMDTYFWNNLDNGFYHLTETLIPKDYHIIAFSDFDDVEQSDDGKNAYTNIITYKYENNNFTFYKHIFDKANLIFNEEKLKFSIEGNSSVQIRNLYVGITGKEKKQFFIASFNNLTVEESEGLIHYLVFDSEKLKLNITSNLLIMNNNKDYNRKILYYDEINGRVICTLKLEDPYIDNCHSLTELKTNNCNNDDYTNKSIYRDGGMAYLDLDGNGSPDIVLSHKDENNNITLQVYTSSREKSNNETLKEETLYCLAQVINVGNYGEYGAFAISRTKKGDKKIAPQFDILIPEINNNKILVIRNNISETYDWEDNFCKEVDGEDNNKIKTGKIYDVENKFTIELENITNHYTTLDTSHFTVIRPGYLLSEPLPGILVNQIADNESHISLYQLTEKDGTYKFELSLKISKNEEQNIDEPVFGVFFDLNEAGALSLIIETKTGQNHFFYNYRKNVFFVKSKLMNDQDQHSDSNLGASFRFIVTDSEGDRMMALSNQLAQTSDMNMPVPYSLVGLGETNNYIEHFQIISGNYIYNNKDNAKDLFYDTDNKNFMKYTPIIPNTQMMIFKFKNSDGRYQWVIELIVQPMDKVLVLALIMLGVMLILLAVIIYLHYREVKEEQKETNKFKSWFA